MAVNNKLLHKLTDGNQFDKTRCLIVVLAGVLLCIIAFPARQNSTKSDISNMENGTINDYNGSSSNAGTSDIGLSDTGLSDSAYDWDSYEAYWEDRLEDALRYVNGVGQVRVLITLKESEYRIVEKDGPEDMSDTQESDSEGGSRTVKESRLEKSTIYITDAGGQSIPYVVKTIAPAVEGVVVIAQGVQSQSVQDDIIEAIQVLFDIEANNIKIVKMKNNQ